MDCQEETQLFVTSAADCTMHQKDGPLRRLELILRSKVEIDQLDAAPLGSVA